MVEEYYRANRSRHLKMLTWALGSEADAEDVFHEAITRALTYFKSYDENKNEFGAWFTRILYNSMSDFRRNKDGIVKEPIDHHYDLESPDTISVDEYFITITKVLKTFPEKQQEIIKLHLFFGYNSLEIHELLGISSSYIRWIIFQFREKLKESIDGK